MEKALKHITEQIALYRKTDIMDGEQLVEILKQITATLYYLETKRSEYHLKFQSVINSLILEGKTVSRAENEAHIQVPEMYQLRRIMDSAYTCVDAIRTNISWAKQEKQNS